MSRIKNIEVFQYSELSDNAKARARDWWVQGSQFDPECEIDEFKTVLHALGFTATDKIFWDINPIDAAWLSSWTAEHCMESVRVEARKAIVADRPTDSDLHGILNRFEAEAKASVDAGASTECYSRRNVSLLVVPWGFDNDDSTAFANVCTDLAHWFARRVNAEYEYQNSEEFIADVMEANDYEFTAEGERA